MKEVFFIPFGASFIDFLHTFIIGATSKLSDAAIVFAGKRPSLYLKKKLGENATGPIYSPRFFSIDEFIDFLARKKYPDYTDVEYVDAIWLLHQSVQSLPFFAGHPFREKDFGDFFRWGKYLLEFINHLDTENIDNERLRSLEKNAQIGYDVPESTNELLMHVTLLREEFHRVLSANRSFTGGYKHLCALQSINESMPDDFEKIFFAGIYAFTGTEKEIIKKIWEADKGDIILESDPREWPILSDLISYLGARAQSVSSDNATPQHITMHSGIDTHAEILKAYDILQGKATDRTAVVLPSADALFPLLSFAIDRIDSPYNISMGYPLSRTSLFDLLLHVLNAQSQKRNKNQYPTAEYLSIMLHPFIKNLDMEGDIRSILAVLEGALSENILESAVANKPFITIAEMEDRLFDNNVDAGFQKIHDIFFNNFEQVSTLYDYTELLGSLLEFILHHTPLRSYILSGEIFRELYEALETLKNSRFSQSVLHNDDTENRRIICDFIIQHLKSINLPFETKPIEDLEVIGVLESRNIAFDTVIMLDVNEGIMPQAKKINPLIPLGIYDILGIPSPEYNEEIFRYYFYRLIRSARNVHLIYIDAEDKPRSRYIEQLIWQEEQAARTVGVVKVDKSNRKINVHRRNISPSIDKTEKIRGLLKQKVFSPSAIDDYVTCPVLFYYRQILKFEEKKIAGDDIEAVDRGKIIHSILHETFLHYLNNEITKSSYKEIILEMRAVVEKQFISREASGDYYLFKKLTAFKLESFLKKHIGELENPFIIKDLESRIEGVLNIGDQIVNMRGIIDRIDYFPHSNEYVIADYKTGGIKQYPRSAIREVDFHSIKAIHTYVNSFQLPLYVHLFMNHFNIPLMNINAKLILLKNNVEEDLFAGYEPDEKEKAFALSMEGVRTVFKDLFDPAKPFAPLDLESCPGCAFKNLCHI